MSHYAEEYVQQLRNTIQKAADNQDKHLAEISRLRAAIAEQEKALLAAQHHLLESWLIESDRRGTLSIIRAALASLSTPKTEGGE